MQPAESLAETETKADFRSPCQREETKGTGTYSLNMVASQPCYAWHNGPTVRWNVRQTKENCWPVGPEAGLG